MSVIFDNPDFENIPSVTEVVNKIRSSLERNFTFIWVKGEITDLSRSNSGHIYFSIKDEASLLNCVWFAGHQTQGEQKFNQLTGEVYDVPKPNPVNLLTNGMDVVCAGKVSFFGRGGKCQLVVDFVELAGIGLLAQAFEALRLSLTAKGYFVSEHKKRLPAYAKRIALVTSRAGAAVHDFLRIVHQRGTRTKISLFPVPVQGEGAANTIAETIRFINSLDDVDVIVLVRGGGSREDLWCFNEEILVKAVYESNIPVLTGIGHEIDLSLADLAADVHAATPTHAAQLILPLRSELAQMIDMQAIHLEKVFKNILHLKQMGLEQKSALLSANSPVLFVTKLEADLERLAGLLHNLLLKIFQDIQNNLDNLIARFAFFATGRRLDNLGTRLEHLNTLLHSRFATLVEHWEAALFQHSGELTGALKLRFMEYQSRLIRLQSVLQALDPEKPLEKGYALVYLNNLILRSATGVKTGDKLVIKLSDGEISVQTTAIQLTEK